MPDRMQPATCDARPAVDPRHAAALAAPPGRPRNAVFAAKQPPRRVFGELGRLLRVAIDSTRAGDASNLDRAARPLHPRMDARPPNTLDFARRRALSRTLRTRASPSDPAVTRTLALARPVITPKSPSRAPVRLLPSSSWP